MEDIRALLEEHIDQEELVKLTIDMVRMESHYKIQKQEKEVAEYIKAYFDKHGIPCEVIVVEEDRHYNVVAALDSGVPGKTLMLNGHMDTVLASGMEDAFDPKIIDGELWGRGTSDMKGPLASAMVSDKAPARDALALDPRRHRRLCLSDDRPCHCWPRRRPVCAGHWLQLPYDFPGRPE